MSRIRWDTGALQDLEAISTYIERRRDLETANRVCGANYAAVQILRRFPGSGRSGLAEGTRELVVPAFPDYIVTYRVGPHEEVELLWIRHGAQERFD